MKVVIHQPEYLPWIGFWNRLLKADVFVALDTATHQKHGFIKRNKMKTSKGWEWFGVPLLHESSFTSIKDLLIDNTRPWKERQLGQIKQYYGKAPYFSTYFPWFEQILSLQWERIADLNIHLVKEISKLLGIERKIVLASQLRSQGKGTGLLVEICKELGADTYLSGPAKREGKEGYMEFERFKEAKIELQFHEFSHPEYNQQYMDQGFVSYMSILDLLFNEGPSSIEIIQKQ